MAKSLNTNVKFSLVDSFLGYRNREDKTIISPGYMIDGSQNVLIDISGRLKSREGYTLYGAANATLAPVYAFYDWEEHKNGIINLRAFSGNLQFDYNGTWTTIKTGLGEEHIRFANFWDNTEVENVLLFVDGTSNVYEWNGATTTFASATSNTITLQGTDTWAELGFYVNGNKKIWLDGVEYTYTGGESTTTLTGVTPDPTTATPTAGDLIYQSVITTANSSITDLPNDFLNDGISNLDNQIYYGSEESNNIYISKINNYKDCSFTTPVRVVGEGALITLRSQWKAFVPQENEMYIAGGLSQWYKTEKKISADNAKETFDIIPLKTAAKQAPIRQESVTKDRNSVVFLSNETKLLTLGRVVNIDATPQMIDYSAPIVNDFDNYDWTNNSIAFWKSYIVIALPVEGKWLILNQTNPENIFWEAPQTGSFSGFSIIDGDLYAHGYNVPETYKLFDGYNDNGNPILSRAVFAYNDFGAKTELKSFGEYWMDGYIDSNTEIDIKLGLDLDGCATTLNGVYKGTSSTVCKIKSDASLGKTSLGKKGLGTNTLATETNPLPPYFNVIKTMNRKDFYKISPTFESYGKDYRWELLSFGPNASITDRGNNIIKEALS